MLLSSHWAGATHPTSLLDRSRGCAGARTTCSELRASVQPVVDFASLKAVLVITNFKAVEMSPLIPTPPRDFAWQR